MAIPADQMANKIVGTEHTSRRQQRAILDRYHANVKLGKALGEFFYSCCLKRRRRRPAS